MKLLKKCRQRLCSCRLRILRKTELSSRIARLSPKRARLSPRKTKPSLKRTRRLRVLMSLSPPYQRTAAGPQIPEPAVTYFAIRIQSLTDKVSLVWQSRVRFGTVPFLFHSRRCSSYFFESAISLFLHSEFFIPYSAATIISAADFLEILRLDLISIDDYLPLCLCMTGVVW